MTEFNAEVFVESLERLGIKLNAVKFPDGVYRINRWLTSYAVEHGDEVNERWQSQLRSQIVGYQSRIDSLAAYLAHAPSPISAKLNFDLLVG